MLLVQGLDLAFPQLTKHREDFRRQARRLP
jgi:hypothetical protein